MTRFVYLDVKYFGNLFLTHWPLLQTVVERVLCFQCILLQIAVQN